MQITFYFSLLKLALLKSIEHKPPDYNFTKQFRNQYL